MIFRTGLGHNYNYDLSGEARRVLRVAEQAILAHRQRYRSLAAEVQASLRVGQGDIPGMRAKI